MVDLPPPRHGTLLPLTRPHPPALATFYASVIQGMSARARDGATREELERVARPAMPAYPVTER